MSHSRKAEGGNNKEVDLLDSGCHQRPSRYLSRWNERSSCHRARDSERSRSEDVQARSVADSRLCSVWRENCVGRWRAGLLRPVKLGSTRKSSRV